MGKKESGKRKIENRKNSGDVSIKLFVILIISAIVLSFIISLFVMNLYIADSTKTSGDTGKIVVNIVDRESVSGKILVDIKE